MSFFSFFFSPRVSFAVAAKESLRERKRRVRRSSFAADSKSKRVRRLVASSVPSAAATEEGTTHSTNAPRLLAQGVGVPVTDAAASAASPPATGAATKATAAPATPRTIAARSVAVSSESECLSIRAPNPPNPNPRRFVASAVEVTAASATAVATCAPSTSNTTNAF